MANKNIFWTHKIFVLKIKYVAYNSLISHPLNAFDIKLSTIRDFEEGPICIQSYFVLQKIIFESRTHDLYHRAKTPSKI